MLDWWKGVYDAQNGAILITLNHLQGLAIIGRLMSRKQYKIGP